MEKIKVLSETLHGSEIRLGLGGVTTIEGNEQTHSGVFMAAFNL